MRREVLYSVTSKIINDIKECELLDFLNTLFDNFRQSGKEKSELKLPLIIFQKYMIATHDYDNDHKEVCEIIGIGDLLDASYWENIYEIESLESLHGTLQTLKFALNQLPKILQLVKQDYVDEIKTHEGNIPEELKGKSLLTVLIVEDEGQFSSPLRLTSALGAITDLYSVVATIENENESDLIVLACDSGSDKSFDFLGLAKVMEEVKEIIIAIWDRRVFHRQRHVSESISLIAESLPILEKIDQLLESGAIAREQAELLKRKTISGATQFIEAGATIPEFEAASSHNPKELMKPEPKLLVSSWSGNPSNERNLEKSSDKPKPIKDNDHAGELSNEESQLLELLLKKSKKDNKPKRKTVKKKST